VQFSSRGRVIDRYGWGGAGSGAVREPVQTTGERLALGLAASRFFQLFLVGAAGRGALGFWGGLLAGGALDLLAFQFIFDFGGVSHV
jgi:hypothetical protein